MKNLAYLVFITLIIASCKMSKNKIQENNTETELTTEDFDSTITNSEKENNLSVSVSFPGDPEIPTNDESDTSHFNVFQVTYKMTGTTQVFVLPISYDIIDWLSGFEEVSKFDTLQTRVRLVDVIK
jgi:hypothetical protein